MEKMEMCFTSSYSFIDTVELYEDILLYAITVRWFNFAVRAWMGQKRTRCVVEWEKIFEKGWSGTGLRTGSRCLVTMMLGNEGHELCRGWIS